jgi:Flp pilus assembly protein TadD
MGRSFLFVIVCAACLIASGPSRAFQMGSQNNIPANENRELSGNVYYADGSPAKQVVVELINSGGEAHRPATTSVTGYFSFHDLSLGSYELSVSVSGYEPFRQTEELQFTSLVGVMIYLKPLRKGPLGNQIPISAHELSMPRKARDVVELGKKRLYVQKDAKGALKEFQRAAKIAPDYYEAFYQVGMACAVLGRTEEAEKSFRKSIEVSGDRYAQADVAVGTLLLNRGETAAGEERIRRGVELDSRYWLGFYELGRAELSDGNLAAAEKSSEKARELAPNEPLVYRLLANVHLQEKNYASVLEDMDAYLKLDPNSALSAHVKQLRQQIEQRVGVGARGSQPAAPANP